MKPICFAFALLRLPKFLVQLSDTPLPPPAVLPRAESSHPSATSPRKSLLTSSPPSSEVANSSELSLSSEAACPLQDTCLVRGFYFLWAVYFVSSFSPEHLALLEFLLHLKSLLHPSLLSSSEDSVSSKAPLLPLSSLLSLQHLYEIPTPSKDSISSEVCLKSVVPSSRVSISRCSFVWDLYFRLDLVVLSPGTFTFIWSPSLLRHNLQFRPKCIAPSFGISILVRAWSYLRLEPLYSSEVHRSFVRDLHFRLNLVVPSPRTRTLFWSPSLLRNSLWFRPKSIAPSFGTTILVSTWSCLRLQSLFSSEVCRSFVEYLTSIWSPSCFHLEYFSPIAPSPRISTFVWSPSPLRLEPLIFVWSLERAFLTYTSHINSISTQGFILSHSKYDLLPLLSIVAS